MSTLSRSLVCLAVSTFFVGCSYEPVGGRPVAYLRRRFAPQPESVGGVREHTISQGDRLDNLAARHVGDPLLFWRICDADGAIRPGELTETVGRILRIPQEGSTSGA